MSDMYCINCGEHIPSEAQYCPKCGSATPNNKSEFTPLVASDTSSGTDNEQQSGRSVDEIIQQFHDRQLPTRAKLLFMSNYFASTAVVPVLLLIGLFLYPLIFLIFAVLYILAVYATAELAHNNFRYCLTETGFEKRQGVIHKQSVTVPYVQIQDVNIMSTMTDRMFGLSRVNIETAGSSGNEPQQVPGGGTSTAEAHLPGVTAEEAKQLHDALFELAHKRHIA